MYHGTHMSSVEYEMFENTMHTSHLDDSKTVMLVNSLLGFEASRIEILLDTREGTSNFSRQPLYRSPQLNYVHFIVDEKNQYEMINGKLYQYYK